MLTSDAVIEFALAVIVGDAFGNLIETLVASVISPCFYAVEMILFTKVHELRLQSGKGWMCLDDVVNTTHTYKSSIDAIEQGCITISWNDVISACITFFLVMTCAYWMVYLLKASRNKEEKDADADADVSEGKGQAQTSNLDIDSKFELSPCPVCFVNIPLVASRCGRCTTWLGPDCAQDRTAIFRTWAKRKMAAAEAAVVNNASELGLPTKSAYEKSSPAQNEDTPQPVIDGPHQVADHVLAVLESELEADGAASVSRRGMGPLKRSLKRNGH